MFRADASPAIGGGHVARCMTLADELYRWGWRTVFACNAEAPRTVPALAGGRHAVIELPAGVDEPSFIHERLGRQAQVLILDHYGRDATYERACRGIANQVMVIDDLADRAHECDLLLDPTPDRRATDYEALVTPATGLLLGVDYVLINAAFRAARAAALERRSRAGSVQRILVSMGATDPSDATSLVLKAFEKKAFEGQIDVVLGSAAPQLTAVRRRVERLPAAKLHVNPADMPSLVAAADLAIGASGTSAWERVVLGVPSLLLVVAANQLPSATAFARRNLVSLFEGQGDTASADGVARSLRSLLDEPAALAQMGRRAAAFCDAQGIHRVHHRLAGTLRLDNGKTASLRAVTASDSALLHVWRGDAETVRQSLTQSVPSLAEHESWLEGRLARLDNPFAMVLVDDQPAGVVRLDLRDRGWEVSITIAPNERGQGVGRVALALLRRLCPGVDIYATVRPENTASRRIFAAAGYEPTNDRMILVSTAIPTDATPPSAWVSGRSNA